MINWMIETYKKGTKHSRKEGNAGSSILSISHNDFTSSPSQGCGKVLKSAGFYKVNF